MLHSREKCGHDATGTADGRSLRQGYYHALLTCSVARTDDAFDPICQAWRQSTSAALCGLWLYNQFSNQFELNGLDAPLDRNPFDREPRVSDDSVIYLVRDTRVPEFVPDVVTWRRESGGRRFRVVLSGQFDNFGYRSALYVPILAGANGNGGGPAAVSTGPGDVDDLARETVEGVVSLHFDGADARRCWVHPSGKTTDLDEDTVDSLLLMGRLTALLLTKLRLRQQAEIGERLAQLAGQHLTRAKDDPRDVRRDYLRGVLSMLESELRIRAASVWWRHPFENALSCLISMGGLLRAEDGRKLLAGNEIADAEYTPKDWGSDPLREAWTYRAYRTGEHFLWAPRNAPSHGPKYVDLVAGEHEGPSPVLMMPIRAAAATVPGGGGPTIASAEGQACSLGVIRCAHKPAVLFKDVRTTFDVVEVRILEFVARQIAPVLHTLEARILREDAIRVIKHDMAASLGTIRDIVHELDHKLPTQDEGIQFSLRNLLECVMSTSGLSDRLARDVEHRLRVNPQKTDIGRQLMPRIKRLLTPYAKIEGDMGIRFDGFEQFPPLNVDPTLVERAIYNLIINAIKYGKQGSTIRVNARVLPEGYAIDVENQGPGVRDEDVPNLFRMYFRSKFVRGEGSGLGLAIVRQIMTSHDGSARLEKQRDPTTFRLVFPARRAAISAKQ